MVWMFVHFPCLQLLVSAENLRPSHLTRQQTFLPSSFISNPHSDWLTNYYYNFFIDFSHLYQFDDTSHSIFLDKRGNRNPLKANCLATDCRPIRTFLNFTKLLACLFFNWKEDDQPSDISVKNGTRDLLFLTFRSWIVCPCFKRLCDRNRVTWKCPDIDISYNTLTVWIDTDYPAEFELPPECILIRDPDNVPS